MALKCQEVLNGTSMAHRPMRPTAHAVLGGACSARSLCGLCITGPGTQVVQHYVIDTVVVVADAAVVVVVGGGVVAAAAVVVLPVSLVV